MFRRRTPVLLQVVSYLVCYLDFQEKFDVEHKRELRFCLMFSFLFSFAKEIKSWPCERVKILQVYLPSGLFVIVSWISFIVPPEVVPGFTFPIFTFTFHDWFIVHLEVVSGFTFHWITLILLFQFMCFIFSLDNASHLPIYLKLSHFLFSFLHVQKLFQPLLSLFLISLALVWLVEYLPPVICQFHHIQIHTSCCEKCSQCSYFCDQIEQVDHPPQSCSSSSLLVWFPPSFAPQSASLPFHTNPSDCATAQVETQARLAFRPHPDEILLCQHGLSFVWNLC